MVEEYTRGQDGHYSVNCPLWVSLWGGWIEACERYEASVVHVLTHCVLPCEPKTRQGVHALCAIPMESPTSSINVRMTSGVFVMITELPVRI